MEKPVKESTESHFVGAEPTLSPLLQKLFPAGTVAAEIRGAGRESWLFPEEAEFVKRAIPKRVREFAAGRACARLALEGLGVRDFILRVGDDRAPIWPDSVIGSISHTTGLCGAVVANQDLVAGLGVDMEVVDKVGRDLWPTICRPEEAAWHGTLPQGEQEGAVALLFSAKEAFYKCQYPLTGEWLDFHDLRIEPLSWSVGEGAFAVHAERSIAAMQHGPFEGRYRFHDGVVTTGVALRRV
jgi:4'-phosphopantetheinyl transferase EntD